MKITPLLLLILLLLFSAACTPITSLGSASDNPSDGEIYDFPAHDGTGRGVGEEFDPNLNNTVWTFKAFIVGGDAEVPPPAGSNAHLRIAEGWVSGTAGCNTIGGGVSANMPELSFGTLISAISSCGDELDQFEESLEDVFRQTAQYNLSGDVLLLLNKDELPLATFVANEKQVLFVSAETANCAKNRHKQCLAVKPTINAAYELLDAPIYGFAHKPGFEYQLLVGKASLADAPFEPPTMRFTLIEVVWEQEVGLTETEPHSTPDLSNGPLLVQHPEWRQQVVDHPLQTELGCEPTNEHGSSISFAPDCTDALAALGCNYLQAHHTGWGDPSWAMADCVMQVFEDMDAWTEDRYLYSRGIDHFAPTRLVAIDGDQVILIENRAALQAYLGAIDSAEKALSAALLHTHLKPMTFDTLPEGFAGPQAFTYFVPELVGTHVVTTDAGYDVLLYDDFDDCTPWVTQEVWLSVTHDGSVTETTRRKAFEYDDNSCA